MRGARESPTEGECERCGAFAPGRERWMFHSGEAPRREFYCERCLGIMRIYAIIGFSILGLILAGLVGSAWWLGAFR